MEALGVLDGNLGGLMNWRTKLRLGGCAPLLQRCISRGLVGDVPMGWLVCEMGGGHGKVRELAWQVGLRLRSVD
ncbi:hypothetical protein CUMW_119530 [Citrus unshiu]|nr:hypothetical protein CUMW_119530 [Citrus unshiu]